MSAAQQFFSRLTIAAFAVAFGAGVALAPTETIAHDERGPKEKELGDLMQGAGQIGVGTLGSLVTRHPVGGVTGGVVGGAAGKAIGEGIGRKLDNAPNGPTSAEIYESQKKSHGSGGGVLDELREFRHMM